MVHETLKKVVLFNETFRIENEIRDFPPPGESEGDLLDPDSHKIQLLKPDGTQQGDDETSPTRVSLGNFYQNFTIPVLGPKGEWMVEWTVTVGTEDTPERIRVKVVD